MGLLIKELKGLGTNSLVSCHSKMIKNHIVETLRISGSLAHGSQVTGQGG